ncbi:DUF6457 domain-containing protein [Streptomyces sp. NPDC049813]|uniref:DUF6457 domain-containing protein n=1 Tax=Streptomyces sp. NPDC049813 TaxID=3365597 RepID=UPI0037A8813C
MSAAAGPLRDAPAHDAVVLAGGAARRLGGADKPGVRVGGRALLDRVLVACAGARATVVVAESRPTPRPVLWAREEPPGGGPLAALEAGVRALDRGAPGSRVTPGFGVTPESSAVLADPAAHAARAESVVVLSADLPFLRERTVRELLDTLDATADTRGAGGADAVDGVLLADGDGRDQPLVAVYRTAALRRVLAALRAEHGTLTGLPLRLLVRNLKLTRITDPVASFDCDTWDDIAAARSRIREHGHVLDEWISAAKDELGLDLDVDTGVLLDLARDAAHGVARPAAPLTTFLVGYAAAQAGGGREAVAAAAAKAVALAERWAREAESADEGPRAADQAPGSAPNQSDQPGPAAQAPGAPAPDAGRDAQ